MNKLDKVITTAKKLIDMPYSSFNLDNFWEILDKNYTDIGSILTAFEKSSVISLMSGNHKQAGIATRNYPNKNKKNIYIVGKGILFDSGGLNLKGRDMAGMYDDKAGMIIALSIANYLKGNIVAYCPVTTNFIQTSKITPGDIIKIGDKKVRVNDTDAEGRLILAEAISGLIVSKSDIIITIATLTGAVSHAIGNKATGVFTLNDDLGCKFAVASDEAKELCWRLPLFDYMQDFYKKQPIKNYVKDIIAGASEGAMFIKQFVKYPENWIHLDIASSAFNKDGKANGIPIKSLINFIRRLK